jgi:hypothetical protein
VERQECKERKKYLEQFHEAEVLTRVWKNGKLETGKVFGVRVR